jgi:broad specificity phosphatase PhoE
MSRPAGRRLRLFLLRHGQVAANRDFRFVGDRDEALTELGRHQAERLGEALRAIPGGVDRLLSSPRRRAHDTARAVGDRLGRVAEIDSRLAEQSFGSWEGLTRQEVRARGYEDEARHAECDRDSSASPPGGESLAAVQERTLSLVSELERDGGVVVLVSHVGPIQGLLAATLGVPLLGARRMFLDPGTISVVDWGARPTIRLFNSHAHLGWTQARWLAAEPERNVLGRATPDSIATDPR